MSKSYTFQPVIPVNEIVDLGRRLASGQVTLVEFKDASGIAGCVLEKFDGVEPATALPSEFAGLSLEQLGERMQALPAADTAFDLALWLPLIMRVIELILARFGGGSASPDPAPTPV